MAVDPKIIAQRAALRQAYAKTTDPTVKAQLEQQYQAIGGLPFIHGATPGAKGFQPETPDEQSLALQFQHAMTTGDKKTAANVGSMLAAHVQGRQDAQKAGLGHMNAFDAGAGSAMLDIPQYASSALQAIGDAVQGKQGPDFQTRINARKAYDKEITDAHPVTTGVGYGAGTLATLAVPAGKGVQAAKVADEALQAANATKGAVALAKATALAKAGAATGAVYGGVSGAEQGYQGTSGQDAAHAALNTAAGGAKGATAGAVTGAVAAPVTAAGAHVLGSVGTALFNRVNTSGLISRLALKLNEPVDVIAQRFRDKIAQTGNLPTLAEVMSPADAKVAGRLATRTDQAQITGTQNVADRQTARATELASAIGKNTKTVTPAKVEADMQATNAPAYAAAKQTPVTISLDHPALKNPTVASALAKADPNVGAVMDAHQAALDLKAAAPAKITTAQNGIDSAQAALASHADDVEKAAAQADEARVLATGLQDRIDQLEKTGGNSQRLDELKARQRTLTAQANVGDFTPDKIAAKGQALQATLDKHTTNLAQAITDSQYNDVPKVTTTLDTLGNVRENTAKAVYNANGDPKSVLELPERKRAAAIADALLTGHGDQSAMPASQDFRQALINHAQAARFNENQALGQKAITADGTGADEANAQAQQAVVTPQGPGGSGMASGAIRQLQNTAGSDAQGAISTAQQLAGSPNVAAGLNTTVGPTEANRLNVLGDTFGKENTSLTNVTKGGTEKSQLGPQEVATSLAHGATGVPVIAGRAAYKSIIDAQAPGSSEALATALTDPNAAKAALTQMGNVQNTAKVAGNVINGLAPEVATQPVAALGSAVAATPAAPPAPVQAQTPTQAPAAASAAPVQDQDATKPVTAADISDDYIAKLNGNEGTGQNPNSSASGTGQFVEGTWLKLFKDHAADLNAQDLASHIKKTADGYTVDDPAIKQQILDTRQDPELGNYMSKQYAADNINTLQSKLGRPVSDGEAYLAHYLGADGAVKMIAAAQNGYKGPAADIDPAAAKANHNDFYDGDTPRTPQQLAEHMGSRFNEPGQ